MGKPRVGDADNEEPLAAKLVPLLLAGTVATSPARGSPSHRQDRGKEAPASAVQSLLQDAGGAQAYMEGLGLLLHE